MSADQTGGPVTIAEAGPLDVEIEAPPSKSLTIRAMAAAALADGRSALRRPLFSDDTHLMARALEAVGVDVARRGSSVVVEGCAGLPPSSSASLDLGNAGTPLRLMTAICCLGRGRFRLDGSARMRERPLRHLIEALTSMGVAVRSVHGNGCPPVEIEADGFPGGRVRLTGDVSSQYLSALLMAAPCGAEDLDVEVSGELVSRPYVDLTIDVMAAFGVPVDREGYGSFHVTAGHPYKARVYPVEGDASSASYFFAAAAIAGGRVRVSGIPANSKQGDLKFVDLLGQMGCVIQREPDLVEVLRDPDDAARLSPVDVDMADMPDMVPSLASVAMFATGPSTIRNIGHLRVKESDRIEGVAACLRTLGASAEVGTDYLIVRPPAAGASDLHGGDIDPRDDHRLAMAFSVAGLAISGVRILNPGCVSKSFPGFFDQIQALC